jgi:hypothetical protein
MDQVAARTDLLWISDYSGEAMFSAAEMQTLANFKRKTAARARHFASQLAHSTDGDRLLLHAAELEAEARDLEQQATNFAKQG